MNSVNMHVIHLNESYMQKKHLFIFNCVTFQIQLWIKMRLEILFSPKSMLIISLMQQSLIIISETSNHFEISHS
jgi:hypothetical protein